jgi:hypothetical protein
VTVAVAAGYTHAPKLARSGTLVSVGDAILKWYEVAPAAEQVSSELRELAYDSLCRTWQSGDLELGEDLGFAILHRCGPEFSFLLVSTWRNDNELWETVLAKESHAHDRFEPWPTEGTHRPTFCVWELGVVSHERLAWSRYLCSERDDAARSAYLRDRYEGVV